MSVWIHPARSSGEACVSGRRVRIEAVVHDVWYLGVEAAEESYTLSRESVLTACWFAATYGIYSPSRKCTTRVWIKRWGAWAEAASGAFWREDYASIAGPPRRPELGRIHDATASVS